MTLYLVTNMAIYLTFLLTIQLYMAYFYSLYWAKKEVESLYLSIYLSLTVFPWGEGKSFSTFGVCAAFLSCWSPFLAVRREQNDLSTWWIILVDRKIKPVKRTVWKYTQKIHIFNVFFIFIYFHIHFHILCFYVYNRFDGHFNLSKLAATQKRTS